MQSYDDLAERLRVLLAWSGLSYRDLHRQVVRVRRERAVAEVPAYNTVYRCLQPGRRRMDVELVFDLATVLLDDRVGAVPWRQACQMVATRASGAVVVPVAGRLPDDLPEFVGRTAEVTTLLEAARQRLVHAHVLAIDGMAGVGKTRLAVHVAHRLAHGEPSGETRLWVNLRGFDRDQLPADPAAVLDGFLRLLEVPGSEIGRLDLAQRAVRFQALLAGRRALVILDNAASVDQVLPLLPLGPGCRVIVTSRHQLASLPNTRHLSLDLFSTSEAVELLRTEVGADRIDPETETAASIAELAGHLPLALTLVAARIRATPDWTLGDHLERLAERSADRRIEDGVETALELSYDGLAAPQQRLLRLLALHPGRDVDVYSGAALADLDLKEAQQLLAGLLAASLLQARGAARFELHDLVRAFAAARCQDEESPAARRAALTRLFDHYRYVAATAMDGYAPHESHRRPRVVPTARPVPELTSRDLAACWLETERSNLLAVAVHCATRGWTGHAGDLSLILFRYLDIGGYYHDALTLHGLASRVAEGSTLGRALANLSISLVTLGRYESALGHLERACAIFREAGDGANEGSGLTILAGVHWRSGRYAAAVELYWRAVGLIREAGDRTAESYVLLNLGLVHGLQGRDDEALRALRRALGLAEQSGDAVVECHGLTMIATILLRQGRYATATNRVEQALEVARRSGYRLGETDGLLTLGAIRTRRGDPMSGLPVLHQGLAMAREEGVRELEVQCLNAVGHALQRLERQSEAAEFHRAALALATELGDRYELAGAHDGLGTALASLGESAAARSAWQEALTLYVELGTPERAAVAAKLAASESTKAGRSR